jgi:hypothetical protein
MVRPLLCPEGMKVLSGLCLLTLGMTGCISNSAELDETDLKSASVAVQIDHFVRLRALAYGHEPGA